MAKLSLKNVGNVHTLKNGRVSIMAAWLNQLADFIFMLLLTFFLSFNSK
jgi:hypothetical protein